MHKKFIKNISEIQEIKIKIMHEMNTRMEKLSRCQDDMRKDINQQFNKLQDILDQQKKDIDNQQKMMKSKSDHYTGLLDR